MYYRRQCSVVLILFVFAYPAAIKGFSWKSCGDDGNPVKITSLSGLINGTILSLTGTAKVAIDLASPVQAEVEMKKKFFWGWSLIPCVKDFGSCTYEDICTMSYPDTEDCPKDFVVNQLPCRCPVPQGLYAAKDFHVNLNILPQWIEKGSYKVKVILKKDSEQMICIIMSETL